MTDGASMPATYQASLRTALRVADLREGVDRQEFFLEYQPIVELASGRIHGVEALVRWRHAIRGVIGPGDFIPVAESSGLIVELGTQVIREACRQAVKWQRSNPGQNHRLSMSVNLSPVQLARPDFVGQVAEIIDASGIEPSRLVFEITETTVMRDPRVSRERIEALRSLGPRVAVDDFGSGYSSLDYIRGYPVDVLKLDRSFVAGMDHRESGAAIIDLFLRLGRVLDLTTVAEGVKTVAEADALRRLGCELAQGFYFSPPIDADAMEALITSVLAAADGALAAPGALLAAPLARQAWPTSAPSRRPPDPGIGSAHQAARGGRPERRDAGVDRSRRSMVCETRERTARQP
jgi:EAL domain-containing protein (putative c-di-GMP-specific phosphodiesterase class I)